MPSAPERALRALFVAASAANALVVLATLGFSPFAPLLPLIKQASGPFCNWSRDMSSINNDWTTTGFLASAVLFLVASIGASRLLSPIKAPVTRATLTLLLALSAAASAVSCVLRHDLEMTFFSAVFAFGAHAAVAAAHLAATLALRRASTGRALVRQRVPLSLLLAAVGNMERAATYDIIELIARSLVYTFADVTMDRGGGKVVLPITVFQLACTAGGAFLLADPVAPAAALVLLAELFGQLWRDRSEDLIVALAATLLVGVVAATARVRRLRSAEGKLRAL